MASLRAGNVRRTEKILPVVNIQSGSLSLLPTVALQPTVGTDLTSVAAPVFQLSGLEAEAARLAASAQEGADAAAYTRADVR